jgi:uncharacterized membrane protein YraQ (UPF0718 family)
MRYLGAKANKLLAYAVASVSGCILAVCSCTVLPLFAGIHRMGAGLGPATTFLYSGPAVNVLAIVLTARVLGADLGVGRAVGAVLFSIVIGLLMHLFFRHEELEKADPPAAMPADETARPLWQNAVYFATMIGILVFANWGRPESGGLWDAIHSAKWLLTAGFAVAFVVVLALWFGLRWWHLVLASLPVASLAVLVPGHPQLAFAAGVVGLSIVTSTREDESGAWFSQTWGLAKQMLPLLFLGVLIAGALLGRPGEEGIIPSEWVQAAFGGNSFRANLFASVAGAFMYFATLTEVPILEALIGGGMGRGPALTLLLAGPALSLPNMLVVRSILGTRKTVVFVALVIVMATACGSVFGAFFG